MRGERAEGLKEGRAADGCGDGRCVLNVSDSVKVIEILYGIPEAYSFSLRLSQLAHHIYKRELGERPPLRLCEVKTIDVRVEC